MMCGLLQWSMEFTFLTFKFVIISLGIFSVLQMSIMKGRKFLNARQVVEMFELLLSSLSLSFTLYVCGLTFYWPF